MGRLSELLDSDWMRLCVLNGAGFRQRRLIHAFSPRFAPVVLARSAQCLHEAGWVRIAKIPALVNFVVFGLEIPPRMSIGPGLVLMHTQGTVLGAASIGANVTLYQQVTLGAREMDFAYTYSLRPVVEDGVVVGAGAKVLGGLILGKDCVVGANAVVLNDVPPGFVAIGVPAHNKPPRNKRQSQITVAAKE